jgi:hypothetical protein
LYAHDKRNRNGLVWFLLAFLTTPLLAFILCAIRREKQASVTFSDVTQHPDFGNLPASEQARLKRKFGHPAYHTVTPVEHIKSHTRVYGAASRGFGN